MSRNQCQTQRLVAVTAALMVTASLTACGGGSDAPAANAEPADKYVGIWTSSCIPTVTGSYQIQFEMNKANATAVNGKHTFSSYLHAACTGTPGGMYYTNLAFTIDDTGTASGKVVDKTTLSEPFGNSRKHLFAVEGNVLYSSIDDPSPSYDLNGYPTALYQRQPYSR